VESARSENSGVNVDEGANDAWKKFVSEHNLIGYIYTRQSRQEKKRQRKVSRISDNYTMYIKPHSLLTG
jgi:hypothetical protein